MKIAVYAALSYSGLLIFSAIIADFFLPQTSSSTEFIAMGVGFGVIAIILLIGVAIETILGAIRALTKPEEVTLHIREVTVNGRMSEVVIYNMNQWFKDNQNRRFLSMQLVPTLDPKKYDMYILNSKFG